MLDIALRGIAFDRAGGFFLRGVDLDVARSTHTALVGDPGCGASTLLELIAGTLRPSAGDVILGQRRANDLKASQRPVLHLRGSGTGAPERWSVEHALVAAVRSRTLDRTDRLRELRLAAEKWRLESLLPRRISSLGSTERARVLLARVDLLRPGILLADRILEGVSATERLPLGDELHRALRVHGTTVISAPASHDELALTDQVAVLDGGRIVQHGSAAEVYLRPVSETAARATGEANAIPVIIRGTEVESVIGAWNVPSPPFQGSGVAIVRPNAFTVARPGEESDLIFGIEEAGFSSGRWIARGFLSGGIVLRVDLPGEATVHKGKLLALRYDPSQFALIPTAAAPARPADAVPPMSETR